ncbi:MAG: hypothetical protein AB7S75_10320 [Desulfococcaceae bacterium]
MKKNQIFCPSLFVCSALLIVLFVFGAGEVFAGEKGGPEWRPTYDKVMMWVNFGILVFILVRFGKKPLMNFLRSQKDELADEIGKLEKEKTKIVTEIEKTQQALKDSDTYFADLKEKIIRQGEQKREVIILQARQQTETMMEIAKQKISGRIIAAKREFKAEMVDAAFDMATERLPREVNDGDNERLIGLYMASASQKAA